MISILKLILICLVAFVLTGCPNEYEKIEQAYYNDQFFLTVQLCDQLIKKKKFYKKGKYKKALDSFITNNGSYLLEKIRLESETLIDNGPSIEIYFLFYNTQNQLEALSKRYSNIITKEYIEKYGQQIEDFAHKTIQKQRQKMKVAYDAKLYRHVINYIQNLEHVNQVSTEDLQLKEVALKQATRYVKLNKVEAFDESIKDAIKNQNKATYQAINPFSLTRYGINIPKVMRKYLQVDFKNTMSDYIKIESSHLYDYQYVVNVKVSMAETESVIPKMQTEKSMFSYKKEDDDRWYRDEFEYDVYVTTRQIDIIVNAEIRLTENNTIVGQFLFQTSAESDIKSVGEFKDIPLNVAVIDYPIEYKSYQVKQTYRNNNDLLTEAMKDASTVLAVKVANTIDIDLDPWLLSQQVETKIK